MKKISVIIPIYKVEKYLCQCVDSVLRQTYSDLEIILIDDGSPDGCPDICDRYASNDKRIRVVHKKNGGLSDARNAGLDIATGEYIGFVDSDDWISPTMYEELISAAIKYDADISCCGYQQIDDDTGKTLFLKQFGNERQASGPLMLKEIMSKDFENVIVCNKLYRASVFHNVRFPFGEFHEDTAVLVQTVGCVSTVAYTGTTGYFYRVRSGSIMKSGAAEKHHQDLLKDLNFAEAYVQQFHPELWKDFRCFDASIMTRILVFYQESKDVSAKAAIKELKHRLFSNLFIYLRSAMRTMCKIETILALTGLYKPVHDLWVKMTRGIERKNT